MAVKNPISWVATKIDNALNKNQAPTNTGLDPHVIDALEILRNNPQTDDTDIAAVLGLAPDVAEPFINHAKRIILKEQLTRPLPATVNNQTSLAPETKDATVVSSGQWIESNVQLPSPVIVRIEQYRQTAERFEDDKEDFADTIVRWGAKILAYGLPVVMAFFVAMVVGEQYASLHSGPGWYWWNSAMYVIALGIEYALWYTSFAASREFKRMLADRSRIGTFVSLIAGFLLFSTMSILAQWFLYEKSINLSDGAQVIGMAFRTCSTTGVDTLSLIVLGCLNYNSFNQFLKRQEIIADHVGKLSRKEVETERIKQEETIRQQNAQIESERQISRNKFFADKEQRELDRMSRSDGENRNRW